jgi:hypothetical protein
VNSEKFADPGLRLASNALYNKMQVCPLLELSEARALGGTDEINKVIADISVIAGRETWKVPILFTI